MQELRESHAALSAWDAEAGFADAVPAWAPLLDALAAAGSTGGAAQQADAAALQQRQSGDAAGSGGGGELLQGADAAVEQVLLWGQTVAAAQSAWAAEGIKSLAISLVSAILPAPCCFTSFLVKSWSERNDHLWSALH